MESPNRLARETSPYLKQHQHNPVAWYPWGDEALDRAREEDKPLLVSIGYSACHWCHVMERESFEDEDTAALMNAHFVNIKVDREERPDVDQIYMDAVVRVTGQGGWPLTVFCTPSGRPFYGGTYFPPEARHGLPAFRTLLSAIAEAYRDRRGEVEESAKQIVAAISAEAGPSDATPGPEVFSRAISQLMAGADRQRGGFGGAPKFPTPTNLELLLAALSDLPEEDAHGVSDFLAFTCREMAGRGLYDQIGGGFHRYCVDDHWGVPHFEKMLYDQGQLLRVYTDLWRRRGGREDELIAPVRETAAYLAKEMTLPDGGLAASQDADSEGVEGKFYVWTPSEVEEVLGADSATAFGENYSVDEGGNFEGKNVLWDLGRLPRERFAAEREALYLARSRRIWPGRDDKRIAAWNALAASGLAYAGSLLEDSAILGQAREIGIFLRDRLSDGSGRLQRVFAEGEVRGGGFLDDYACATHAYLDLYRAGCGDDFAAAAVALADDIAARFYEADESDLYLTPKDASPLAVRPRSDHDGATPHSAGFACLALLRCGALAGRTDLSEIARAVARRYAAFLERAPHAFPTLLRTLLWDRRGFSCAVIAGEERDPATQGLAARARRLLDPDEAVVVIGPDGKAPPGIDPQLCEGRSAQAGRAMAYVCLGTSCHLPVHEADQLTVWKR